jgi:hypothetical protein
LPANQLPGGDVHEWVSFDDPTEDRTWVFDVTFLTSNWRCIFGDGCQGVLTGPTPELMQGCCSYGAHFVDEDDLADIEKKAKLLTDEQWQFKRKATKTKGAFKRSKKGDITTRLVDDACIFLNRPGFEGGAGCALHRAALDHGERPVDWKPDVCWQLPLRLTEHTDDGGHMTSTLREWKRRDWGDGGFEFHWWCTEDPEAFIDQDCVYVTMRDEIVEMVGEEPYAWLVAHLHERGAGDRVASTRYLPHPALRERHATRG